MKKIKIVSVSVAVIALLYSISIISGGCAQIGMPVGGPKDTLPPVLVAANPVNKSVDFKSNRITLTFDEYIQLDNPIQNVIVSPIPKKNPFIDFKLKTVSIKLYDTLIPNKTYAIQFGNTIRDLNENNPYKDFDYVFSTGKYIDSLTLEGSVTLAETGKADSTLTVLLYSDLSDSAVYKHKPEYIARLNKEGKFRFKYLSPGSYNIFALKDEGGQYLYNNPSQIFAFADSVIHLGSEKQDSLSLYAYQQEKEPVKKTTTKTDTAFKLTTNLKSGVQDLLEPLILTFTHPIHSFDSSRITLTDTLFNTIPGVSYTTDTSGTIVNVNFNWEGSTDFRFIIPANAVSDSNGRHLAASDTLKFKTKNESDYGSLKLNFKNLDKYQNPVLILVPENGEGQNYPLTSNVFQKKLLPPGNYNILLLEDKNKNGKWDPGNYAERLQPEIVHRLGEPISIRANWDNEKDVEFK